MNITNPATGIQITTLEEDTSETIEKKYTQVRQGQIEWTATPLSERLDAIRQFSKLLASEADEAGPHAHPRDG